MKAIYTFSDDHTGKIHILIPKIREVQTALGSIVVTFDNGDRKTFQVDNLKQALDDFMAAIEAYYSETR